MKWAFWIEFYIRTHCVARGLRPLTLVAYEDTLQQFREWVRAKLEDRAPDQITARDVLNYVQHLREERGNGDSIVNRAVVVLRRFYCAMVAMAYGPNIRLASFPWPDERYISSRGLLNSNLGRETAPSSVLEALRIT